MSNYTQGQLVKIIPPARKNVGKVGTLAFQRASTIPVQGFWVVEVGGFLIEYHTSEFRVLSPLEVLAFWGSE